MAFIHYQFEAIHPFLDGNGRIGRLLLVLLLCWKGLLPAPLLYLSAYFEMNRAEYYGNLLAVSQRAEWESWILFFLKAVASQANDAVDRSTKLLDLQRKYREILLNKRASGSALRLLDYLFANPAITISKAAGVLGSTNRSAQKNVEKLEAAGLLTEVTGRERGRIYMAQQILSVIEGP